MHKLYLQIFLAFIGIAFSCMFVASIATHIFQDSHASYAKLLHNTAVFIVEDIPFYPVDKKSKPAELQEVLKQRAKRLGVNLTLWGKSGQLLATTDQLSNLPNELPKKRRQFGTFAYPGFVTSLPRGGWVGISIAEHNHAAGIGRFLSMLFLLIGVIAVGCYWLARRITRRLEALRTGVEIFGSGDLSYRAKIQGKDEVAELAKSFNQAAIRIDALIKQQKRFLASASHELRSPLTRLRMALELLTERNQSSQDNLDSVRKNATIDIQELDELIGDLLLAARLEEATVTKDFEVFNLQQMIIEEGSRFNAEITSQPIQFCGNKRMLKRLLRNLLENAQRYGKGAPIQIKLDPQPADSDNQTISIIVADRGPGIPTTEQARIFEPFYRPLNHSEGEHGGVGLGLYLVRQIAEYHNGTVRYLRRDGGGSCFEVNLRMSLDQ